MRLFSSGFEGHVVPLLGQCGNPHALPVVMGSVSQATNGVCPFASKEVDLILHNKRVLADTGCTAQFCQGGRMIHSNETRLGESRPLHVLVAEAEAFLWELWQDGVYAEDEYRQRLNDVVLELERGAVKETVWIDGHKKPGITSTWIQTSKELSHGLRLAWKNSKRCIMRSHYGELQ